MKQKIYLIIFLFILGAAPYSLRAQGCVAVRNMASFAADSSGKGSLQFSLNYRYFRSYKHFKGKDEQEARVKEGTEVINKDNFVLLGIYYNLNDCWAFAGIIPYISI